MITPLLDLFVALIPFLILGTVMTTIHIVDVGIAKPVSSMTKPQKSFDLNVKISDSRADILSSGKNILSVEIKNNPNWMKVVHTKLVEVKKSNLEEFKVRIEPAGSVKLETVMGLMDEVRELKTDDPELYKQEGQKKVKLKYLFPQVVLKGVYGS